MAIQEFEIGINDRRIIDNELGISVEELEGGKRRFEMNFGSLGCVEVLDIPSRVMSDQEWRIINLCRRSYGLMWGGAETIAKIEEDPFDGRPPFDQLYKTRHQIATFTTPTGQQKIITNRKVEIDPANLDYKLYDDIDFWQVIHDSGNVYSTFWRFLSGKLTSELNGSGAHPELHVAAISRTGVFPYSPLEKGDIEHDRTAIAWSLMQIATTYKDENAYFVCQLCEDFPERVHNIRDINSGNTTKLDFTKTIDMLNVAPELKLKLDRNNPYVQSHLFEFPGYWLEGKDVGKLLKNLVDLGKLSEVDFRDSALNLLESPERPLLKEDQVILLENLLATDGFGSAEVDGVLDLFTKPRYLKYLIPLIATNEEFKNRILTEVRERPFSSTLRPEKWRESAKSLLRAAKNKYKE